MLYSTEDRSCSLPENDSFLKSQELILAVIFSSNKVRSLDAYSKSKVLPSIELIGYLL
jgi:hypothetical protein